ncbi:tripeptidyl-peptidase [Achlya hypogyna]|uniref:subtilisin n=1 Tax=Achlya hypogyna TaxID=1202772 RepID=A0A1V9YQL8_ACHHY|nr:tripeptidyl-peptidase [Achlya hypogyna]
MRLRCLVYALLAAAVSATPTTWRRLERASHEESMELRIHLQPAQDLAAQLTAVADIASPTYGRYLESVDSIGHPTEEATAAMRALLQRYNPDVSLAGETWRVVMPVADVEVMFQTQVHSYGLQSRRVLRATGDYSIPNCVAPHVLVVDGLSHLPRSLTGRTRAVRRRLQSSNPMDTAVTIEKIQQQYRLPADLDSSIDGNSMVIGTFLNETYLESDIDSYMGFNRQMPLVAKPSQKSCMGGGRSGTATSEASLDVQLLAGLTRNNDTTVLCYNELRLPNEPARDDNQEPFLQFMKDVNALEKAPSVVSISYADDECALPPAYRDAIDLEFIKAGLRGTTIVVASGDNGVVGSRFLEDFGVKFCTKYQPSYPSSSPYIVSVGATTVVGGREVAVSIRSGGAITTGGGFSSYAPRPSYQAKVVDEYKGRHTLDVARFNSSGRAYPDVAAIGHNVQLFINGFNTMCDGTSASAPIVGAVISHMNKHRLQRGLPRLGFVNPYLYKLYEACPFVFNDVVNGENACGALNQPCCANGFAAGLGWDPIGGLGSINYEAFAQNMEKCEALMKAS